METTTDTTTDRRAWVGCLACYNSGALVGAWVDALEAGDFVPCSRAGHEEFWVMDHEGLPIKGECSPTHVQQVAELMEEIEAGQNLEAVAAYADNMHLSLTDWADWSEQFEDAYRGTWDTFEAYADDLLENLGILDNRENDSILRQYFDFERWARDLEQYDYWTANTSDGVAVFCNF